MPQEVKDVEWGRKVVQCLSLRQHENLVMSKRWASFRNTKFNEQCKKRYRPCGTPRVLACITFWWKKGRKMDEKKKRFFFQEMGTLDEHWLITGARPPQVDLENRRRTSKISKASLRRDIQFPSSRRYSHQKIDTHRRFWPVFNTFFHYHHQKKLTYLSKTTK